MKTSPMHAWSVCCWLMYNNSDIREKIRLSVRRYMLELPYYLRQLHNIGLAICPGKFRIAEFSVIYHDIQLALVMPLAPPACTFAISS
jgi:hypothetical protein